MKVCFFLVREGVKELFGRAETDLVRFKRGFEEGRLKDKFALFEASFSYKSPTPERRKPLAKLPLLQAKRAPV